MSEGAPTLHQVLVLENEELRGILAALPLAILIKDRTGRFLFVSPAGAPGYGVSHDAMIGRTEAELLPPGNDLAQILAIDQEVIDSGTSHVEPSAVFQTHDGRPLQLFVFRIPVRFEGKPAVLVAAWDESGSAKIAGERALLERKLAQTQRLEGLGLMAGGIAHDFNNLLVGVFANADLALREVGDDSRAGLYIGRLKSAAQRLADLSRQMLAYSGRGHVERERLDVGHVVAEISELLHASIPPQVELTVSVPEDLLHVNGDRAQLTQVIMNLVTNAAEAIAARSGNVRIDVRNEYFDSARFAGLAVRPRREATDYICIEVSDDGPGMDHATRDRIFDPFFTTKAEGRGLGLASVLGIVRAHHGALNVDSTPGQGTRMRVWLPPADRLLKPRPQPQPLRSSRPPGQRVLIIDDEPVVREATSSLLETYGFEVLTAADGQIALALLEQAGKLDAVLLDMTMPGPNASDTHRALRRSLGSIPIVLCSGFNDPDVLDDLLGRPDTSFIQKPYSPEQLLQCLDTVIR
jgi:two-component system cell cycle sensor histidine kinase/response regulator CckA